MSNYKKNKNGERLVYSKTYLIFTNIKKLLPKNILSSILFINDWIHIFKLCVFTSLKYCGIILTLTGSPAGIKGFIYMCCLPILENMEYNLGSA